MSDPKLQSNPKTQRETEKQKAPKRQVRKDDPSPRGRSSNRRAHRQPEVARPATRRTNSAAKSGLTPQKNLRDPAFNVSHPACVLEGGFSAHQSRFWTIIGPWSSNNLRRADHCAKAGFAAGVSARSFEPETPPPTDVSEEHSGRN